MRTEANIDKLIEEQYSLASRVLLKPPFASAETVRTIGGLDVDYRENSGSYAACVVVDLPSLETVETARVRFVPDKSFSYVPGLFAFREMPSLLAAVRALKRMPDVLICDGQGIAHPRRLGLAAHLGVILGRPTIGCAKTHLYGDFQEPPPGLKGAYQYLRDDGDVLGIVLRTRPYVKPLFVSPGNLMNVDMAGDIVMRCITKYRLPEPLRRAHELARRR